MPMIFVLCYLLKREMLFVYLCVGMFMCVFFVALVLLLRICDKKMWGCYVLERK